MTLRTVEDYWPNGELRRRYLIRLWEDVKHLRATFLESEAIPATVADAAGLALGTDYDEWYENGQKRMEVRCAPVRRVRGWFATGQLSDHMVAGTGIVTMCNPWTGEPLEQRRLQDDVVVDTRTSPPWFTEEEILQSVEGVEE